MNGEEFYDQFKAALDFLGVGFRGKADVEVTIVDGIFTMTVGTLRVSFPLPPKE